MHRLAPLVRVLGFAWAHRGCCPDAARVAKGSYTRSVLCRRPHALVVEADHATWKRRGRFQLEGRVDPFRKQSLSAAQDDRVEEQMKLIDQIVLEKRMHELLAPVREDVLAGRRLELANRFDDLVANDRRVAPNRLFEALRYDVLGGSVHHVPEKVARLHRLERVRVRDVRLSSE